MFSGVLQVPLVEQHYSAEFLPYLKSTYNVERVSGDCQLKISFTDIVKNSDVIICTAQILENFLERSNKGEDEGVNLSGTFLQCRFSKSGKKLMQICPKHFLCSVVPLNQLTAPKWTGIKTENKNVFLFYF